VPTSIPLLLVLPLPPSPPLPSHLHTLPPPFAFPLPLFFHTQFYIIMSDTTNELPPSSLPPFPFFSLNPSSFFLPLRFVFFLYSSLYLPPSIPPLRLPSIQIFDKALDEPSYSSMYAQLCLRLNDFSSNLEETGGPNTVSFPGFREWCR